VRLTEESDESDEEETDLEEESISGNPEIWFLSQGERHADLAKIFRKKFT
jgi:hypothetical protein